MDFKAFYDEHTISKLLYCPGCKRKYNEAKILPCGIYCLDCVQIIVDKIGKNREFRCQFCDDIHLVPSIGFKDYNVISELNSSKPKFTLNEVYRGEEVEQLKENLRIIKSGTEDFSENLSKCISNVNNHCTKLRNDVIKATQAAKKKVDELGEDIIEQINNYQTECNLNIQNNKIKMHKFEKFLQDREFLHKKWAQYLDNYQINEKEVKKMNSYLRETCFEKEFENEQKSLRNFTFNRKVMTFSGNEKNLENSVIGDLEFELTKIIDFEKDFQASSVNPEEEELKIDFLEDGRMISSHITENFTYHLKVLGINSQYLEFTNTLDFKFKAFKNQIILYMSQNDQNMATNDHSEIMTNLTLKLLDSQLKSLKQTNLQDCIKAISATETNIYCLLDRHYQSVLILNYQLQQMKTLGQSCEANSSFYFSKQITMFEKRDKHFYCLSQYKLDIVNEKTGMVNSTIYVPGTGKKIFIDSEENLIVVYKNLPDNPLIVSKYAADGQHLTHLEVENLPDKIDYFLDKQDNLVVFDKKNLRIVKTLNGIFA